MSGGNPVNIIDLKPGMEHVKVKGRVLEAGPPKVIQTKKGPRTISNAVIGDSTGRVETTLWGEKAGTIKEGQAVEITGAWTTSFRGKVQLNVGRSSEVREVSDAEVPQPSEVPADSPTAPEEERRPGFQGRRRSGFRPRRG
ncbi:MAG: OB-fold nucleic acid binding domain-containing protein [Thermogladius sp.]